MLTILDENARLDFLPTNVGPGAMLQFENNVYDYARYMLTGYTGGYWEMTAEGVMYPHRQEGRWLATSPNGAGAWLSDEAAGLFICTMASNHMLSFDMGRNDPVLAYHQRLMALVADWRDEAERAALYDLLD